MENRFIEYARLATYILDRSTSTEEQKEIANDILIQSMKGVQNILVIEGLRIFTMGTEDEPPTPEELDYMTDHLRKIVHDPSLLLVTTSRLKRL